ncbi:MAG: tetratricopeptide repeat protein [Holophagaceae bacterium]|nr:tetratricopeptide repeat protein [Holophagaceae bacterium]
MNQRNLALAAIFGGVALFTGCESEERLKAVEREAGELKVEVFKLRQQQEENTRKADTDRKDAVEWRTEDRQFRADLQETLRQLSDATKVMNNRMGTISRTPATVPAASNAVAPTSTPDDEKAFGSAVLDYNRGNYAIAAEGLDLFLRTYPNSVRKPDALFFLGMAYYNQKNYEKSQGAFDRILRDHPSSSQFLPAKLKRGQCLLKQGLKPAALRVFKELVDGFPGTPEARTAQQEVTDLGY